MAYSETLAARIRNYFHATDAIEEKAMMGGLTFMLNGKMCVGIIGDELMCRIDRAKHEETIKLEGCRTMDFTSKPMIGYVLVDESAIRTQSEFSFWMEMAIAYNPFAKASKKPKKKIPKD